MSNRAVSLLLIVGLVVPCLLHGQDAAAGENSDPVIGTSRNAVRINDAQHPNTITIFGGAFENDLGVSLDRSISVRLDHRLTRFFSAEVAFGYVSTSQEFVSLAPLDVVDVHTPMTTADVMLHAQLPIWRIAPYVGITGGVYHVQGDARFLESSTHLSHGLLGGLKILLTNHVGVRGEIRWRDDGYDDVMVNDFEQSVGLTYRF